MTTTTERPERRIREPAITILDGVGEYMTWAKTQYQPGTLANRERHLMGFASFFVEQFTPRARQRHPQYVRDLRRYHVSAWSLWRSPQGPNDPTPAGKVSKSSFGNEASSITAFLKWAYDEELIDRELAARAGRRGNTQPEPDPPPDELVRQIIAEAGPVGSPQHGMAWLLAATGMRPGPTELLGLRVRDWNPQAGTLTIPNGRPESTKRHHRTFHVGPETRLVLDALAAGKAADDMLVPMPEWAPREYLRHYDWNGRPMCPRRLRQWFCSALEAMDMPDRFLDLVMGHASVHKTRRHYSRPDPAECAPWLAKLEERLGETPHSAPPNAP